MPGRSYSILFNNTFNYQEAKNKSSPIVCSIHNIFICQQFNHIISKTSIIHNIICIDSSTKIKKHSFFSTKQREIEPSDSTNNGNITISTNNITNSIQKRCNKSVNSNGNISKNIGNNQLNYGYIIIWK